MANSNPPYSNAPNAAQYAGYSQFYATPQARPPPQPRGPPPVFARPPPPGPARFPGMRPPPPGVAPPLGSHWAPPRGPPPPPPRGASMPGSRPAANQWQWGTGSNAPSTVVASAPPVMYNAPRGPAARPAGPPAVPKPTAVSDAAVNSTKWPDSLHDYVKRAFARCKGAADQSLTQNALKGLISNAIMTNTLWTKNWHAEPLPTLVGDTVQAKMAALSHHAPRGPMGPPPPPVSFKFHQAPSVFKGPKMPAARGPPGAFIGFNQSLTKAQKRKSEIQASKVEDMNKKSQRKERFLKDQFENAKSVVPSVDPTKLRVLNHEGELDLEAMTIKGTSKTIEKEYLRLTSPPHPSTVRPEPILKQALEMVKSKWKEDACDYIYACSQLKSIRQDCTVQRIKNEFTVLVYETHARVALESGDINEFNQCQTQLHELYEKAIPGQAIEFLSYRILYCIYVSLQAKKPDSNTGQLGMYSVLASITPALRKVESVRHALAVREAVSMNDFHRFFKLHAEAPKMAGYLMDPMVTTIRLRALRAICKAYRPNVPIDFVRQELSLEGKEGDAFIQQAGVVFVGDSKGELVDTKNSEIVWVLSKQSSLI